MATGVEHARASGLGMPHNQRQRRRDLRLGFLGHDAHPNEPANELFAGAIWQPFYAAPKP